MSSADMTSSASSPDTEDMVIDGPEHHGIITGLRVMLNDTMEIDEPENKQNSNMDIDVTREKHADGEMDYDVAESSDNTEDTMYEDYDDDYEDYPSSDTSDQDDEEGGIHVPQPKPTSQEIHKETFRENSFPAILISAKGTSTAVSPFHTATERREMMKNVRSGMVLYSELDIESIQINFRK